MRYPVGCPRKVRLLEQQARLPHLALPEIHIGELLAVVVAHDKAASNSSTDQGGRKRVLGV